MLALALLLTVGGCDMESAGPPDDLALAQKAMQERDLGEAEMHLERYLRKNADGAQRWLVWNTLLEISLNVRQDLGTAAEYLEIMLAEFRHDPPKRRGIQMQLAAIADARREYGRAVAIWESLAADPETKPEDRAAAYRELSGAYLRRLEFAGAREVLGLCLELDVGPDTRAGCFYALAETQMLTDELPAAEQALKDLLALEGVSESRRVAAVFMLADVAEQRGRLEEAENLLESIRGGYPNDQVVDLRLQALKAKQKERRDNAPRVKK